MSTIGELLKGLDLSEHGRGKPPGSWQHGGPGDQDWETYNSQLLHEWLRFLERMTENIFEQCRDHGVTQPPIGWRDAQIRKFRRLVAKHYDGLVYPQGEYLALYEERLAEKNGPGAVELFREKWRQCS